MLIHFVHVWVHRHRVSTSMLILVFRPRNQRSWHHIGCAVSWSFCGLVAGNFTVHCWLRTRGILSWRNQLSRCIFNRILYMFSIVYYCTRCVCADMNRRLKNTSICSWCFIILHDYLCLIGTHGDVASHKWRGRYVHVVPMLENV